LPILFKVIINFDVLNQTGSAFVIFIERLKELGWPAYDVITHYKALKAMFYDMVSQFERLRELKPNVVPLILQHQIVSCPRYQLPPNDDELHRQLISTFRQHFALCPGRKSFRNSIEEQEPHFEEIQLQMERGYIDRNPKSSVQKAWKDIEVVLFEVARYMRNYHAYKKVC